MVFLVPRLLADVSPLVLSAGRYTMYGLVSAAVALPMARSLLARLTREDLIALVQLAIVGNLGYYMLLANAVHLIGIAPSSLIVGVLPVTITFAGLRDADAVPLRRLALPLALVAAGIVCINVDLFTSSAAQATSTLDKLAGIACAAITASTATNGRGCGASSRDWRARWRGSCWPCCRPARWQCRSPAAGRCSGC